MEQVFTINKDKRIIQRRKEVWVAKTQGEQTEHTCRTKAIIAVLRKYPSDEYGFLFSNGKYRLLRNDSRWTLVSPDNKVILEKSPITYTVRTLLSKQPNDIDGFQIVIPEGIKEEK